MNITIRIVYSIVVNCNMSITVVYEVHLDYDDLSLEAVEEDVRRLMRLFNLHHAWIYMSSSGNHYHAFIRPPLAREEMLKVVAASKCHKEYKKRCRDWQECAIRVRESLTKPKPVYVKSITQ